MFWAVAAAQRCEDHSLCKLVSQELLDSRNRQVPGHALVMRINNLLCMSFWTPVPVGRAYYRTLTFLNIISKGTLYSGTKLQKQWPV